MSKNTADNLIKFVETTLENNTYIKNVSIFWFGGEPLLDRSLQSINYIHSKLLPLFEKKAVNYINSLVTNGSLLDSKTIKILKKNKLNFIQITLDGTRDYHNQIKGIDIFDKVIKNIKNVITKGINVGIRINVSKENRNKIESLLDYLASQNLHQQIQIHFAPVQCFNELCGTNLNDFLNKQEFSKIQTKLIKYAIKVGFKFNLPTLNFTYCSVLHFNSCTIDPEGKLYSCNNAIYDNEMYASINDHELKNMSEYHKYINFDIFQDIECLKCKIFPLCKGGCIKTRLKTGMRDCNTLKFNLKELIKAIYSQK